MKFEITRRGVRDSDGEVIEIGDTVEVETKDGETPAWLVNKAVPVKGGKTTDAGGDQAPAGPFTVEDGGKGWWTILDAKGAKVGKGLREDDAKAFGTLTEAEQAEFAAEHAKA